MNGDTQIVKRFLWFPKTLLRREGGSLSETRWLELAQWKRRAWLYQNGASYWWEDLHWAD